MTPRTCGGPTEDDLTTMLGEAVTALLAGRPAILPPGAPLLFPKRVAATVAGRSWQSLDRDRKRGLLAFHVLTGRVLFSADDVASYIKRGECPATARPA